MPSPFPGMDPYLEAHWGDMHQRLIIYACDVLQKRLPGDLRARVEERLTVEAPRAAERKIQPDLRIMEQTSKAASHRPAASAVLEATEPVTVVMSEPVTEGFIEIRKRSPSRRLVTVVELLSRSNKFRGRGRREYLKKRAELRRAEVSLVEIDLLRAGARPSPVPRDSLPISCRTTYLAWAIRGWENYQVEFYGIPLRQPLPILKIPLRPNDQDVCLALQPLLEQCYQNGGYDDDLDYDPEADPPLGDDDAKWADKLLRKAGVRSRKPSKRNGKSQ